mmetsp:Transcript_59750/g.172434  ORF Transcript_59750/g.172434 Transcript_59750/m.172434 type:complete len:260 (-) Transcript_59750:88-867(-)|eukprot:CAMPEP_0176001500 /NCGR_PEP_ID=MMETSP0120_2-20121206/155_1 /TAXON_ID=160619 /ORGANISM="Kryptoperidinium foliaceum, Strain CCMP 1326" /LENGTH=259 /DNA_ID=CAMNT_0017334043 /DNA_START=90 /DNA_END=869 /DNA_ORIENTATION=+
MILTAVSSKMQTLRPSAAVSNATAVSRRIAATTASRSLSYSLQNPGGVETINARPSYQVYGDETSLSFKLIPPEFRAVSQGKTIILNKKGRLFLEWVPKGPEGRFLWDRPLRFALSPEEMGLLLTRMKQNQPIELHRKGRTDHFGFGSSQVPHQHHEEDGGLLKVFRAEPLKTGDVKMSCDYELDGRGGQQPATEMESQGPLSVELTAGEVQVVQSIVEYSLPRLTGWSHLLDHSMEQAFAQCLSPPGNYGFGNDGPPF